MVIWYEGFYPQSTYAILNLHLGLPTSSRFAIELGTELRIFRHSLRDQVPEFLRMVHLSHVAELMHDDIVRQVRRQKRDLIVEADSAGLRARPPTRFLIAYRDFFV